MSGALAARAAELESEKGRVTKTKVTRYWPGRAPEWGGDGAAAAGGGAAAGGDPAGPSASGAAQPAERSRTDVAAPVIVKKADDPRLRRLQAGGGRGRGLTEEEREAAIEERRRIHTAEVVVVKREEAGGGSARVQPHGRPGEEVEEEEEEGSDEEGMPPPLPKEEDGGDDEEAAAALLRRQALRERMLQQEREEAEARAAVAAEEESESEEESFEYETDSEDEIAGRRMLKPLFVPKVARETIAEREALEAEEEKAAQREKERAVERKAETQQLVREVIAAEAAAAAAPVEGRAAAEDIVTDDEEGGDAAYDSWKARELTRIKRDRDEKERLDAEVAEKEKLRNMTEAERAAYLAAQAEPQHVKEKPKLRFMQKYWHKGAFFQEAGDDTRATSGGYDIYRRDYSAPTGDDNFDKAALPEVMQVRNFGRAGRTKWKHLAAEDTMYQGAKDIRDDPFLQSLQEAARKRSNIGARTEDFQKPKKFKT